MATLVINKRSRPPPRIPTKLNMEELVKVVNKRYNHSLLRRRFVPQAFCYVCTRLDPTGIFRNPNTYLFRRGFFTACEHFPKAPHSTFVGDNFVQELGVDRELPTVHSSAPSITVTIKRGSSLEQISREHTRSSLKPLSRGYYRERTHSSIHEKPERTETQTDTNEKCEAPYGEDDIHFLNEKPNTDWKDASSTQSAKLPPLQDASAKATTSKSGEEVPTTSTDNTTDESERDQRNDEPNKRHLEQKYSGVSTIRILSPINLMHATIGADTENELIGGDIIKSPVPKVEKITEKPARSHRGSALSVSIKSDRHSAVSGLSILSKRSPAWTDSPRGLRAERGRMTNVINRHDGLGPVHLMERADKDFQGFDEKLFYKRRRPRAGRVRRRTDPSELSADDERDERLDSGHFLYHHRNVDDSVPDPGFVIPATPTEEERLEMERLEQERELEEARLAEERREIEEQIAAGNVFVDVSSKSDSAEEDEVINLPEGQSHTASAVGHSISGKLSFCKCSSDLRKIDSMTIDTCQFCGKFIRRPTKRTAELSNLSLSRKASSLDSRRRILFNREKISNLSKQLMSKTDEDYMDLDGIIHGEDSHYWSEDTSRSQTCTRSSIRRRLDAKPYPLADPNLHKFVYVKALQEARSRKYTKTGGSNENTLTKPHVFSYFQLWPFAGKRANELGEADIGLRQDVAKPIKQGQYMKHIFGDVKPDDYYPGGAKSHSKKVIIGGIPPRKLKGQKKVSKESKEPKEPSVVKMRLRNSRQGVSFCSEDD